MMRKHLNVEEHGALFCSALGFQRVIKWLQYKCLTLFRKVGPPRIDLVAAIIFSLVCENLPQSLILH